MYEITYFSDIIYICNMNNLKNSTKKKYIRLFKAYNDVIFEAGSNARFMSKESLYTMAGKKVEDDYSPPVNGLFYNDI